MLWKKKKIRKKVRTTEVNKIVTVVLKKDDISYADEAYQWNYGQILRIQGGNLPKVVEVHFSLEETSGTSVTRIGTTVDGVTEAPIPDSLLENNNCSQDYTIYAYIYLENGTAGRTEYEIAIPVKARTKPEVPGTPEEPELFRETVKAVNDAADRAEQAEQNAKASEVEAGKYAASASESAVAAEKAKEDALKEVGEKKQEAIEAIQEQEEASVGKIVNHTDNEIKRIQNQTADSKARLEQTITNAGVSKEELDESIQTAGDTKTALDKSTELAGTAKTEMDTSTQKAGEAKTALDGSARTAGEMQETLNATVKQAGALDTSLNEKIETGTQLKTDLVASGEKAVQDIQEAGSEQLGKMQAVAEEFTADREQITINKEDIGSLKEDLTELGNKILYEEYADLLHGKEPKENWYIAASNGSGKTLKQFFSFTDIDVSNYIGQRIYPYSSIGKGGILHSSKSIVFYDKNGSYIEGHGTSSNNSILGLEVPNGAKTVSACFNYDSDDNQPIKPQVYYLAINRENKNKLMLKKDVSIDYEQIQNKPIIPTKMSELKNDVSIDYVNDVQTIRKPTISFIFDDGLPSTSDLVSLFDSYGWKCGFAILANSNLSNIKDNFLSYQSKGYEILSHSTDGVAMQDGSLAIDDVETKMKKSKEILINNGFNITGWVTPSTWLNNKYFKSLCKYYEYGFGHLDTNPAFYHHVFWGNDIRQLERWSLQSKTLEKTKAEIDSTINECGYLCFYAHAYPSTVNDNFTVENMKIIMDYIKKYVDNGKVQVLTPRCAINDYYKVRYSDLFNLYKK